MKYIRNISKGIYVVLASLSLSSCLLESIDSDSEGYTSGVSAFHALDNILSEQIQALEFPLPLEQYLINEAGDFQISEDRFFPYHKVRLVEENTWCILSGKDTVTLINTNGASLFTPGAHWAISTVGSDNNRYWQKIMYRGDGEWSISTDNYSYYDYYSSWFSKGETDIRISDFNKMAGYPSNIYDCSFTISGELISSYMNIYFFNSESSYERRESNRITLDLDSPVSLRLIEGDFRIADGEFSFLLSDNENLMEEKVDIAAGYDENSGRSVSVTYRGEVANIRE